MERAGHRIACSAVCCAGIRVPDSAFIRSIARAYGGALALTSANVSGGLSTLAVNEFAELWDKVRNTLRSHIATNTLHTVCSRL